MPKPHYTVGGTVQASGGIYLERKADQELLKLCREGAFAYVLTSRQLGKSSLMVRAAEQLKKEGARPVIIDLTEFGIQVSAEAWYLGLLTTVADSLELDVEVVSWWRSLEHFGVTQRLTKFFVEVVLAQVHEPIVIFIDEIDSTLSLPFTDDFYAAIRYLYNARAQEIPLRRLTFVLIGVATPSDLISDPHRTPFNIGQQVNLTDFTFEEALSLAEGLSQTPEENPPVLRWVLKWTGGHPYLTQRLCRTLSEEFRSHWTEAEIDQAVKQTFFGKMSEEDNNLQFVRDMLTKRALDKLRVLEDYKEIRLSKKPVRDEEQSPIKAHLKLSGIIKREAGKLLVRNPIYHEVFNGNWIKEHWPVSWFQTIPAYVKVITAATFFLLLTSVIGLALYVGKIKEIAERDRQLIEAQALRTETERKRTEEAQRNAGEEKKLREIAEKYGQDADSSRLVSENLTLLERAARNREELERVRAQRGEFVADSLREEEKKALQVVEKERKETERARYRDLARLLATQAPLQQQLGEHERAMLLARQAFLFNQNNGGRWLSQIHDALVKTLQGAGGPIVLRGHTGAVRAVAFSAGGEWLASGSDDGTLRLWPRQKNYLESKPLTGHTRSVRALAFGGDDDALISGSEDKTARRWNLRRGDYVSTLLNGHQDRIWAVAFSPDEKVLATGGADNAVLLWHPQQLETGSFAQLPHSAWVRALAFSADRQTMAAGSEDGAIVLWRVSSEKPERLAGLKHEGGLKSLAFHPRQPVLMSGGNDGEIMKWNLNRPQDQPEVLLAHNSAVNAIAFSADGRLLATGSSGRNVKLWDFSMSSHEPILIFAHDGFVWSVAFSPDAGILAVACSDKNVYLWLTQTEVLATKVCEKAKRNLTQEEWRKFIGADIEYERTCPNLPGEGQTSN